MTAPLSPTFGQIKARVDAVRAKRADARVIGIRSRGPWAGEERVEDGGARYRIRQCDAPLQFRMAFREPPEPGTTMVLITPLEETQLGDDIRVRLAGRRLFTLDPWQIVGWLFGARRIDPRVTAHDWVADMLMALAPVSGYPPVPNRVLDAETVWEVLLKGALGMETGDPDLIALLKWSSGEANVRRWGAASEAFRGAAADWIILTAGPAAGAILNCVSAAPEPLALPAGLALGVIYADPAPRDGNLDRAAGRLEQLTGNPEIPAHLARQWHGAAAELIRSGIPDPKARHAWLERSDAVLERIGASDHAHRSDVSPLGFDQRLALFAQVLEKALSRTPIRAGAALFEARDRVFSHELAGAPRSRRMDRMVMAIRLLRWLEKESAAEAAGAAGHRDFAEAARAYALDGGFVDWARTRIGVGDPLKPLSGAYARLEKAAARMRERENRIFAELLRDWTRAGSAGDGALPIEAVLERIVAPLLPAFPMLILLIDGMSHAVFQELLESVTAREWAELCPAGGKPIPPVIAALPSVTRCSRASFFMGRLAEGDSREEARGFSGHPALKAASGNAAPPRLFHKIAVADAEDGSLSGEIRQALGTGAQRLVGVVLNAVDDYLGKGDQTDPRWTVDFIRALSALLYEARAAGRLVLLLSDHGHVPEWGTVFKSDGEGERWRRAEGGAEAGDGELRVSGSRVLADPGGSLIALWSEAYRYGANKKNGYHGGLSPQEMLIPMALLSGGVTTPEGWQWLARRARPWWEEPVDALRKPVSETDAAAPISASTHARPSGTAVAPTSPPPPSKGQLPLFQAEHPPVQPPEAGQRGGTSPRIPETPQSVPMLEPHAPAGDLPSRLIGSAIYQSQKAIAGRAAPDEAMLRKFLAILLARGGRITAVALSRELGLPAFRLRGWIAAAQRLLNVEGYAILGRDEASETLILNIDLLKRQFELDGA